MGDFSYSPNFSTKLTGATLPVLGETFSIVTGWPGGVGSGSQRFFPEYTRKYFLRVGARINKQVNSTNVYNYSTVKEITDSLVEIDRCIPEGVRNVAFGNLLIVIKLLIHPHLSGFRYAPRTDRGPDRSPRRLSE